MHCRQKFVFILLVYLPSTPVAENKLKCWHTKKKKKGAEVPRTKDFFELHAMAELCN